MRISYRCLLPLVVLASCLTVSRRATAMDIDQLAKALARLRGDIEDLSAAIEDEKNRGRMSIQSLEIRKTELEATLRRQNARIEKLRAQKLKLDEAKKDMAAKRASLLAAVSKAVDILRGQISRSLPFRVSERLSELDELKTQVDSQAMSPIRALGTLWERVEDELRLARESAIDRQVIEIDGEERLTQVLRVGMLMIYFLTDDETAGRVVKTKAGWVWQRYEAEADVAQVAALFDSFRKRIRVGFFEVPNALTVEVSK